MSKKTIDEKVVSLQFDNKNFEANVATTMTTLDKLKVALHMDGAKDSMDEVDQSVQTVNVSLKAGTVAVATFVQEFTKDAMKKVKTTLEDSILSPLKKIEDATMSVVRELSSGNMMASGWDKYAQKTSSVQTIMAATRDAFEDEGEQMQFVNEQLNKLVWFTDETSYNMVDMISNISKFTSNKVALEDAVVAMEGIALEASLSGANAEQASRAMYNFSQAMGVGSVKVQDWMSIENATMATAEFKDMLIQTAYELKTIKKDRKGNYYSTGKKQTHELNAQTFRSTLADEWLTGEVLVETLRKYGAFTQRLSDVYLQFNENGDFTTSEILEFVNDFADSSVSAERKAEILNETIKATGLSSKEALDLLKELGSAEYELGRRAFEAGQQAKTFQEVINATTDAVSSKWMLVYEYLIGDYHQAAKLFTSMANEAYNIFASPVEELGYLVKNWDGYNHRYDDEVDEENKNLKGRQVLIEALSGAYRNLANIVGAVKSGFREVFPAMTAKRLYDMTVSLRDFVGRMTLSEKQLNNIKIISQALASLLDIILIGLRNLTGLVNKLLGIGGLLRPLVNLVIDGLVSLSKLVIVIHDFLKNTNYINEAIDVFIGKAKNIINYIVQWIDKHLYLSMLFGELNTNIHESVAAFKQWIDALYNGFTTEDETNEDVVKMKQAFADFADAAKMAVDQFEEFVVTHDILTKIKNGIGAIFVFGMTVATRIKDEFVNAFSNTGAALKEAFDNGDIGRVIDLIVVTIADIIGLKMFKEFKDFQKVLNFDIHQIAIDFDGAIKKFSGALSGLTNLFKTMQTEIKAKVISEIAKSVLELAIGIGILALADANGDLKTAAVIITGLTFVMSIIVSQLLKQIDKIEPGSFTKDKAAMITAIILFINSLSTAVIKMALGMRLLKGLTDDNIGWGIALYIAILAGVGAFVYVLNKQLSDLAFSPATIGYISLEFAAIADLMQIMASSFVKIAIALRIVKDPGLLIAGIFGFAIYVGVMTLFIKAINDMMLYVDRKKLAELTGMMGVIAALFTSVAKSFVIMAIAIKIIGSLDSDVLNQGVSIIVLMLGFYTALMLLFEFFTSRMSGLDLSKMSLMVKVLGDSFNKLAAGMLVMSLAIAFLGNLKWGTIIKGLIALSAVLAVMVVAVALLQKMDVSKLMTLSKAMLNISVSILSLSAALALFTVTLLLLGTIGTAGLAGLVLALKVLLEGIIDIVIVGIGRIFEALVTTFIAQFEVFCKGLTDLLDILIKYLPGIIDKFVSIIIMILNGLTKRMPELALALGEFFNELFQAGLVIFSNGNAAKGIMNSLEMMGALAILGKLFQKLGKMPIAEIAKGIGVAGLMLTEVVGLSIIISEFIAGFDTILGGNAIACITHLGEILEAIGVALGSFVGGLLGGIVEGTLDPLMDNLSSWGTSLGTFGEKIKPFIETLNEVDDSAADNAVTLAAAIGSIINAEFVAAIFDFCAKFSTGTDIDTGSAMLTKFANQISLLGGAMVSFSDTVSGKIDEGTVTVAANSALALSEVQNAVTAAGALENNPYWKAQTLEDFGDKIIVFAQKMVEFSNVEGLDSINSLDAQTVKATALHFAELQNILPKQGGAVDTILGVQSLALFGAQCVAFAEAMVAFTRVINGTVSFDIGDGENKFHYEAGQTIVFNMQRIRNAKFVGYSLADLASVLPKIGGVKQFWEGTQDLGAFGATMVEYAKAIIVFNEVLRGQVGFVWKYKKADGTEGQINHVAGRSPHFDNRKIDSLIKITDALGGLAVAIADTPSATTRLSTFLDDMVNFAMSLSIYTEALKQVGLTKTVVDNTDKIVGVLSKILNATVDLDKSQVNKFTDVLDKVTDAADKKKHDGDLESLGKELNNFSGYIPGFVDNLMKLTPAEITTALKSLEDFIGIGLKGNEINSENFQQFSDALKGISNASLQDFKGTFSDNIPAVNETMRIFFEAISKNVRETVGPPLVTEIKNIAVDGYKAIDTNNMKDEYTRATNGLLSSMRTAIYTTGSVTKEVFNNMLITAAKYPMNEKDGAILDFRSIGSDVMNGLLDGMNSKAEELNRTINSICETIPGVFKENLQINSPSKIMIGIGEAIPEGLAEGMNEGLTLVRDSVNTTSEYVLSNTMKMRDNIVEAMSDGEGFEPTIAPIFDFNGFENKRLNLTSGIELNIRRPMDSLSNRIFDAQARIEASNNRVVDSINMLRQDVKDLKDLDKETNLYVDGTRLASSIAKPMDRQLNILAGRRKR